MLKDLQDREPESEKTQNAPVVIKKQTSQLKLITLVAGIFLLCNIVGWYVWSLYDENKTLKTAAVQMKVTQIDNPQGGPIASSALVKSEILETETETEKSTNDADATAQVAVEKSALTSIPSAVPAISKSSFNESDSNETLKINKQMIDIVAADKMIPEKVTQQLIKQSTVPAKMSVSRRSFSAAELVSQKLTQAETAILSNKIGKAEGLFEEVLIIDPSQVQARKKLAALWFGRQALQDATNLLSQGIALSPNDSDLRMLQAQIYVKQAKHALAYQALIPLAKLKQVEYQLLIANSAQQTAQYDAAINAYHLLIKMKPNSARSYLGLAIVHDRNSQFLLAIEQYKHALSFGSLSVDSSTFVQQRIQALGE
jgi:MSHA biogenesis protein MshN